MVQHGQRFWGLMLQSLYVIQYFYTFRGVILPRELISWNFHGPWNQCILFHGPTWHIFNGIFMIHEIEIIISHFSRPLKSLSVILMAHGIYNTPTFHGSWTLVADISWQFHEPWHPKPIINFSWKIHGLKNRPWTWNICIQGPEKCFPGFLMTFSWHCSS